MIERVRGDSYPIEATIQINGVAVVLGVSDTITLSYIGDGETIATQIAGVISDANLGKVNFFPAVTDFQTVGTFKFDIQRTASGIKTTHLIDKIKIIDDINKG